VVEDVVALVSAAAATAIPLPTLANAISKAANFLFNFMTGFLNLGKEVLRIVAVTCGLAALTV
jgi:hypothetical protein